MCREDTCDAKHTLKTCLIFTPVCLLTYHCLTTVYTVETFHK